jgi:hypothetical protein
MDVKPGVFFLGGGGVKLVFIGRKGGGTLVLRAVRFVLIVKKIGHLAKWTDIYIHNFGGGCLIGNVHLEYQKCDGRLMLRYVLRVICCKKGSVWCYRY